MTASGSPAAQPLRIADARNAIRHVFIRDLVLSCRIGVHRHEEVRAQRSASTSIWPCAMIAICKTISPMVHAMSGLPSAYWIGFPVATFDCWRRWRKRSRPFVCKTGGFAPSGCGSKAGYLSGRR